MDNAWVWEIFPAPHLPCWSVFKFSPNVRRAHIQIGGVKCLRQRLQEEKTLSVVKKLLKIECWRHAKEFCHLICMAACKFTSGTCENQCHHWLQKSIPLSSKNKVLLPHRNYNCGYCNLSLPAKFLAFPNSVGLPWKYHRVPRISEFFPLIKWIMSECQFSPTCNP